VLVHATFTSRHSFADDSEFVYSRQLFQTLDRVADVFRLSLELDQQFQVMVSVMIVVVVKRRRGTGMSVVVDCERDDSGGGKETTELEWMWW